MLAGSMDVCVSDKMVVSVACGKVDVTIKVSVLAGKYDVWIWTVVSVPVSVMNNVFVAVDGAS